MLDTNLPAMFWSWSAMHYLFLSTWRLQRFGLNRFSSPSATTSNSIEPRVASDPIRWKASLSHSIQCSSALGAQLNFGKRWRTLFQTWKGLVTLPGPRPPHIDHAFRPCTSGFKPALRFLPPEARSRVE
jgi:hypothetical protein